MTAKRLDWQTSKDKEHSRKRNSGGGKKKKKPLGTSLSCSRNQVKSEVAKG